MNNRTSLFCDTVLAARVERAEAKLITAWNESARGRRGDALGFAMPVAGGVASFAEPDSPINKVAGLGFADLPAAADLEKIERAYAERGAPVQAEVASLADPGLLELL